MKILNICYNDYANFMYGINESMVNAGMDAKCMTLTPHSFAYKKQAPVVSNIQMIEAIREADFVQIFHSRIALLEMVKAHTHNKRYSVWHTGSPYRNDSEAMNKIFADATLTFTDQCEFILKGTNFNYFKYVACAIDTDTIFDTKRVSRNPFYFAHYPSNPSVKGTNEIEAILKKCLYGSGKASYLIDTNLVPAREQLKRMANCHIYVELFKPILNGNPYGCYGVTAFEAASMGKAVITQNIYPTIYNETYGIEAPFLICNTERELFQAIKDIESMSPKDLVDIQSRHREWVVKYHSYEATGKHLKKIFAEIN